MNNYLTSEAIGKLQEEIQHRKSVVRKKINEDLKEARAQGDLSENYEYKAAKTDRARNEGRIHYLEKMIKTATVIKDTTSVDQVGLGKTITLKFVEDDEVEDFKIVTTIEANPMDNLISIESPLGAAIYKHTTGDQITVKSPEGNYIVVIEKITT